METRKKVNGKVGCIEKREISKSDNNESKETVDLRLRGCLVNEFNLKFLSLNSNFLKKIKKFFRKYKKLF